MEVLFYPKDNYQTEVPIIIEIKNEPVNPIVNIETIGKIPLKKNTTGWKGTFWFYSPGRYNIKVKGNDEIFTKEIMVEKYSYFTFSQEFIPFFILLSLALFFVFKGVKKWSS